MIISLLLIVFITLLNVLIAYISAILTTLKAISFYGMSTCLVLLIAYDISRTLYKKVLAK